MKFGEFAQFLNRLEQTASRNEMTVILAELYGQVGVAEAKEITYLLSGTLGPAYRTPNFGVADKMLLRALGDDAVGVFKKFGDMGLVAEELHTKRSAAELNCDQVYKKMYAIATVGGEGSQEQKLELIRSLLTHLDALSAKYAVRIILGKLRTGFSDMTVLDGLSWMISGDKKQRSAIEAMYNVRADLGEIAEEIVKHRAPKTIHPEVGTPILMAKAERATSSEDIWERNGACALEYKLDGLRIQAHVDAKHKKVTLFSRGLEDVTSMYPDVVEGLAKQMQKSCIVEGEMIAVGKDGRFLPFQETMQRKRKYDIVEMAGKIPLTIYLFDVLVIEGKEVMNEENAERRKKLEKLVKGDGVVKLITRIDADSVEEIETFYRKAIFDGTEGIIAKKMTGPYQPGGRDFNWIKYKESYAASSLADTIDVVVMGYDLGQGKRAAFGIGDFLVGVFDPKTEQYFTVAKIGTGLTDDEWKRMKREVDVLAVDSKPDEYQVKKEMLVDVWAKPKIVVEIHADEITKSPMHSSEYALRFPRLISWREKKATDATSLKELLRLFGLQQA